MKERALARFFIANGSNFDHKHFDIRIGTITNSKFVGSIIANSDNELNIALED